MAIYFQGTREHVHFREQGNMEIIDNFREQVNQARLQVQAKLQMQMQIAMAMALPLALEMQCLIEFTAETVKSDCDA